MTDQPSAPPQPAAPKTKMLVGSDWLRDKVATDPDLETEAAQPAEHSATSWQKTEVAAWITAQGFATGHGDTIKEMLDKYKAQELRRRAPAPTGEAGLREAVAKVVFDTIPARHGSSSEMADDWQDAFRAADQILALSHPAPQPAREVTEERKADAMRVAEATAWRDYSQAPDFWSVRRTVEMAAANAVGAYLRIVSAANPDSPAGMAKEGEDAQPYKDVLGDLVFLKAQNDIGCVPPPTKEQWAKAWSEAEELVRVEP